MWRAEAEEEEAILAIKEPTPIAIVGPGKHSSIMSEIASRLPVRPVVVGSLKHDEDSLAKLVDDCMKEHGESATLAALEPSLTEDVLREMMEKLREMMEKRLPRVWFIVSEHCVDEHGNPAAYLYDPSEVPPLLSGLPVDRSKLTKIVIHHPDFIKGGT